MDHLFQEGNPALLIDSEVSFTIKSGLKTSKAILHKQAQSGILIHHCVCEVFNRAKCAFLKMTVKKHFFSRVPKVDPEKQHWGENRATK